MRRILITEHIRTRADFFNALGRTRGCEDCGPRNLDDLSLIHISEPTRPSHISRMPSSA